ncbi:hypothetical protein L6279_00805 [Candidatus Parcubacteria bacterium]|nr:hypothetical protein [Candidatus Parcubacteria bacterium]
MLAFNKALEMGCDGVELDGLLTKDKQVVIIHDQTLNRTTNGKGLVCEANLSEIKALDAGQCEKVPTMEEILAWAQKNSCLVNLELKDRGMINMVGKAILEKKLERQVFVTSFLLDEIAKFKKKFPNIQVGFIFDHCPWRPQRMVREAKAVGVYILSLKAKWIFKMRGKYIVKLAHNFGLKVHVWNVDDKSSAERMKAIGVDGLISNCPEIL